MHNTTPRLPTPPSAQQLLNDGIQGADPAIAKILAALPQDLVNPLTVEDARRERYFDNKDFFAEALHGSAAGDTAKEELLRKGLATSVTTWRGLQKEQTGQVSKAPSPITPAEARSYGLLTKATVALSLGAALLYFNHAPDFVLANLGSETAALNIQLARFDDEVRRSLLRNDLNYNYLFENFDLKNPAAQIGLYRFIADHLENFQNKQYYHMDFYPPAVATEEEALALAETWIQACGRDLPPETLAALSAGLANHTKLAQLFTVKLLHGTKDLEAQRALLNLALYDTGDQRKHDRILEALKGVLLPELITSAEAAYHSAPTDEYVRLHAVEVHAELSDNDTLAFLTNVALTDKATMVSSAALRMLFAGNQVPAPIVVETAITALDKDHAIQLRAFNILQQANTVAAQEALLQKSFKEPRVSTFVTEQILPHLRSQLLPELRPYVRKNLHSVAIEKRHLAIQILSHQKDFETQSALVAMLSQMASDDEAGKALVVQALSISVLPELVPQVLSLFRSGKISEDAFVQIVHKTTDVAAQRELMSLLKNSANPNVQDAASRALENVVQPAVIPNVVAGLKSADHKMQIRCANLLKNTTDLAAQRQLVRLMLSDPVPEVREAAYDALPSPVRPELIATVRTGFESKDPIVRKQSLVRVWHTKDSSTIQAVKRLLNDPNENVRAQARFVLGLPQQ